jgi:hypothetical protein
MTTEQKIIRAKVGLLELAKLLRLERTIPHPGRERFTPAANLPFPCSVTTVGNDDMKFIAQQDRHD